MLPCIECLQAAACMLEAAGGGGRGQCRETKIASDRSACVQVAVRVILPTTAAGRIVR